MVQYIMARLWTTLKKATRGTMRGKAMVAIVVAALLVVLAGLASWVMRMLQSPKYVTRFATKKPKKKKAKAAAPTSGTPATAAKPPNAKPAPGTNPGFSPDAITARLNQGLLKRRFTVTYTDGTGQHKKRYRIDQKDKQDVVVSLDDDRPPVPLGPATGLFRKQPKQKGKKAWENAPDIKANPNDLFGGTNVAWTLGKRQQGLAYDADLATSNDLALAGIQMGIPVSTVLGSL
jgi:hypothetical protein